MRPLPPKEAIDPHHCWHFLGYSTAIPIQLVNSSRMVSALEIKLYCFFFLCPVSLLIGKKKVCLLLKKKVCHLLSQQEANSQAIWWISHTTSYVDIRDFWVQKQIPQKSKDFWLKMGAIRWSIFLERPLNASVTQNTSSWMIHQIEVLWATESHSEISVVCPLHAWGWQIFLSHNGIQASLTGTQPQSVNRVFELSPTAWILSWVWDPNCGYLAGTPFLTATKARWIIHLNKFIFK